MHVGDGHGKGHASTINRLRGLGFREINSGFSECFKKMHTNVSSCYHLVLHHAVSLADFFFFSLPSEVNHCHGMSSEVWSYVGPHSSQTVPHRAACRSNDG